MINKNQIKSDIKALLKQMAESEDKEKSYEDFSVGLANIVVEAIKSADVKVNAGISVSVVGASGTSTGVTTNPGTGSLS